MVTDVLALDSGKGATGRTQPAMSYAYIRKSTAQIRIMIKAKY